MSRTFETVGDYLGPIFEALGHHDHLVKVVSHPNWQALDSACINWSYNHVAVFRHPDGIRYFLNQVYQLVSTSASATLSVQEALKFMKQFQDEVGGGMPNTVKNRASLYARWIETNLPEVMGAIRLITLRALRERMAESGGDASEMARSWLNERTSAVLMDASWPSRWATELLLTIQGKSRPDVTEAIRLLCEHTASRIYRTETSLQVIRHAETLKEQVTSNDPEHRHSYLGAPVETASHLEVFERIPALLEKDEKVLGDLMAHVRALTDFARDGEVLSLAMELHSPVSGYIHQHLGDRKPLIEQLRKTFVGIQAHQAAIFPLASRIQQEVETPALEKARSPGCAPAAATALALLWLLWHVAPVWSDEMIVWQRQIRHLKQQIGVGQLVAVEIERSHAGKRPEESHDDNGIEMTARTPAHFHQRVHDGNARTVPAVAGHGVKSVSQCQNPTTERDLIALELAWIAVSIESLVM